MSDLALYQPDTRGKLPAILIAAGVLAVVAALLFHFSPHDTASISLSHTAVFPTRTVFKSNSMVVGPPAGQDDLYLLTTLHLRDDLRVPVTIDTITATLITAEDQQVTSTALTEKETPAVFIAFPQMKPMGEPLLLRETEIHSNSFAEGQLVFHFPVTQAVWDHRKSANITVHLYNEPPQSIVVP